ncbi:hypothetical protein NDU88_001049 [Pleurodeles waltl]|uniref:Uncharacterized protein n=1 Tax=Pleurodeles waltl TaxID=8319 RepID=A0AAV7SY99_PLEWA|nr:hypothetical protein NDU88_001049 [Pleurodeles waltl]
MLWAGPSPPHVEASRAQRAPREGGTCPGDPPEPQPTSEEARGQGGPHVLQPPRRSGPLPDPGASALQS